MSMSPDDADERLALVADVDCYVSLHRSEGLGLTMAEAMAAGTPVIATGYSGNLDFMLPGSALLVDATEIEIGPVFHRLPERIKAHAAICFIALILYRVMRQRLSSAEAHLSPERALEELQKLQHHQIRINQADRPVTGISRLSETQDRVFAALRLKKPTQPQQLSLL